ncbi:ADP-ribose pyrophosphatase [Nakamurella sp. YIM 132087]|uniref:ADP-ribose pyrophosphatase n=1 Tax=Nakamurella alba TaxID=2665158 RepID=A0A7K1FUS5_9ACTN|nr:ADP-ribose pyrophosphatase [Nakamurella alba]
MRTLSSTLVFRSPWLQFREDRFVRRDGSRGTYGVVDKPDFAVVIAEENGCFHLVEQYRYAIGRRSWEFPMGGWPVGSPGGSALELARAELAEETGYTAEHWEHLGHLQSALGFCSQGFDIYRATGLTPGEPSREESEADMVHRVVTETEFRAMIGSGEIVDSVTLACYARLQLHREALSGR